MDWEVVLTCIGIVLARILDVSLGTLRTVCVVNGRRMAAVALGFVEVLVWVIVVSKVIANLTHPAYAISYAFGFALGNFLGLTIERWVAFGDRVVRVFSREGQAIARALRNEGFTITEFAGQGRDGPVYSLYIQTRRRAVERVVQGARAIDPNCFYTVEDIRIASAGSVATSRSPIEPRGFLVRK